MFVLLDCAVVQRWVLQDHVLPRVAILSGGRSHTIRLATGGFKAGRHAKPGHPF